ncbi:MAG: cupredoxin domain-containing protein [Candidatus Woykebacteria bacterium]
MRNLLIAIIIIIVIAGGFLLFRSFSDQPDVEVTQAPTATTSATPSAGVGEQSEEATTITYTSSGFSPSDVTVKSGDTITWMNNSDQEVQVGVDPHPIHTGDRELSGDGFVLTLQPGEQANVTMTTAGPHGYHNHLNSGQRGTITVE